MDIIKQFEQMQKRSQRTYLSGSIEHVFRLQERSGRDESGQVPVIIKPEPEEKRKSRSMKNKILKLIILKSNIKKYIISK